MYKKILLKTAPPGMPVSAAISAQAAHTRVPYPQTPPAPQTPHSLQLSFSGHPLIMVIDDSDTVRKIIQTSLRREGFTVVAFPDGVEAMKWFSQPDSRIPDLVILDIGLPKLDGYEVARHFKAKSQFSSTIIIMLSRRDGVIDRLKGRLVGAKEYLTKPFKTQEINAVVKSYVGSPAPR